MATTGERWWRDGVLYQIYPRSWADANGDGIGDLQGIIDHLDHLEWLGIDGVWINPIMPSPNADWGYDVADYTSVDPDYGTLDDLDRLVKEASARGIRILMDLVPNHTSDQHAWFVDSRSAIDCEQRDWYVWRDASPDGSPPNNWLSILGGGPAWELDEKTGQYYLHNFLKEQPDLNWWNEGVRDAFDDIVRFWFDRGIAGFRIDVVHAIVNDPDLRDNPPATPEDHPGERKIGQRQVYNVNRPEVHEVLRRWRRLAEDYEQERVLIGETYVWDLETMAKFYGEQGDELHLAFNFPFIFSQFEASALSSIVATTESLLQADDWPIWTGSNHDVARFATRWCGGDERKMHCALVMLLMLRGTPMLYYGDEIGMRDADLHREDLKDPAGIRRWPQEKGRDPCRTPMQWSDAPNGGFTTEDAKTWLPVAGGPVSVAGQRDDPESHLRLCRDLIRLRKETHDLRLGRYERLEAREGTWAWRRGEGYVVALNLSDDEQAVEGVSGEIAICTARAREGEQADGTLRLGPWEGTVVRS